MEDAMKGLLDTRIPRESYRGSYYPQNLQGIQGRNDWWIYGHQW